MARRVVGVNERGIRVGQWHQRAILTDADIDRMLQLRDQGFSWKKLAAFFECSARHCRDICSGKKRQMATRFKEVEIDL
ncbi:hypothetical protein [Aquabacterium sp. UBA2148]|uniref:hypothetical protein n=1 Tax=Aquabacterium sp. UBA2148 TaxID=1946042 RepID=UPI00257B1AAD|nr:hypothetical protein [Aquabacterium sp. UBA2148]